MAKDSEQSQDTVHSFGEWVRTRRRALDLTQDELARRASCARVTIRKIESDELIPSKELAQVLAEKLGVPAQERDQFVKYARSGKHPEFITAQTADIPPWRDEKHRHNLPESVTTFVGREREMAEIKNLVSTSRLLTLTGSGGVGKTRLALHVAADLRDAQWDEDQDKPRPYRDGVWFIELAPLSDPSLVPTTIANVLGVREEQERSLIATLSDWLRDKHLLLILDNCEHLIEAGSQFADAVLRTSHDVRILATSRERLGITGETAYRVPSLAMPNPKNMPPLETLSRSESVRLFIERAQAAQPKFALAEGNALAVAQLCYQLDGIPLALELAAARVQAFSVEQINERLDDRFRLLTGGSRTALPRQQTLRALVDWSYDLLSESERVLLRRLSVFAGGWTLEAAESVCGEQDGESGQTTVPTDHRLFSDVLKTLARLVDKSLVVVDLQAKEPRYHLLETIRQYAHEKLLDANENERLRDQHFDFFQKLAEQSESAYYEGQLYEWIPSLEVEHDNLRAALEWACERDLEKARWMAGLLRWFWLYAEHLHEARTWYARVLKSGERASKTKELATALLGAAVASAGLEEHSEARVLLEESVALYRELGDKPRLAEAIVWLGNSTLILGQAANACALYEKNESLIRKSARRATLASGLVVWARAIANARHDYTFAKALLEESIAIQRESKNSSQLGHGALMNLGYIAMQQGDYAAARQYLIESLERTRKLGTRFAVAHGLRNVADVMSLQGDYPNALPYYEEALTTLRELGHPLNAARIVCRLGYLALRQEEVDRAMTLFGESLELFHEKGELRGIASCLAGYGELNRVLGRTDQAIRLLGFVEAYLQSSGGTLINPTERFEYERSVRAIRESPLIDETKFNAAWEEGKKMTMEQAIELGRLDTSARIESNIL